MTYLPPAQVAHYAYDAGFRGNSLVTAVAIAGSESSFNPSATSPANTCLGLWQINKVHDTANPSALYDPSDNAKMAYSISDHGTNWRAWSTYTNGSYKKYLSVAKTAAKAVANPSYPSVNVEVDGQAFSAIAVNNETYLLWTALSKWGIPYKYLGNGKFSIQGQTVQGVVDDGNTYLNWSSIPDIQVTKVNGEFSFTDSY
ncbi:hypothetical protein AAC03nite_07860 [Alicyclobacillus acidoterrestris]|uniref:transglycosylase SLT domain-containing protein n=1 Tax=Alicyclobacillus suci TaxID=2816080 RepID=UPI0011921A76|nr:transglycosylase SLT domain-containing protein [Alicyclobacillus suci]GEO25001.1 hypothetical protein AAC03nite_07860 [Alicyclobacillus acidoterrestris]